MTAIAPQPINYRQWFALLVMKCMGPEFANRSVRHTTLRALTRRGYAALLPDGSFEITRQGIVAESRYGNA